MKSGFRVLRFVFVITLISTCFGLFSPPALAAGDNELRIGFSWGPSSNPPDPAKGWDGWYMNEFALTETLMVLDFDQNLTPKLAESCTNIEPTVWEVRLRKGITFHDGSALNAQAVKASFERMMDESKPTFNKRMRGLLSLKQITVKDDYTLWFETEKPMASFAYKLADPVTGVVSPNSGDKGVYGTGPFKFVSMSPNEKLEAERYDGYWGKKAGLSKITCIFNKDPQAKMLAFEAGDLDVINQIPEMDVQRLEGDSRFRIMHRETNRLCFLIPRIKAGPLSNPDILNALNYAIDRREIVEVVLSGVGGVAGIGVFPTVLPWHNANLQAYPYDKAKAAELLKKAGAKDSDGDGFLEFNGEPIKLRIWTYEGRPALRPTAELIQDQLKRVGIDSKIRVSKSTATCEEAIGKGEAEFVLYMANSAPQGDPDYFVTTYFDHTSLFDFNGYHNPEVEKLAEQGRTTFNYEKRKDIYDKIQDITFRENALLVVFYKARVTAVWDYVKNYRIHPAEVYVITPDIKIEK